MTQTGIFATRSDRLGRILQVGVANGRVISVAFPEESDAEAGSDHPALAWLEGYLAGTERDVTDLETGLTVPTDQRSVLETVRKLPFGESIDLKRLVARTPGLDPEASEDVELARTALAENPVPIVIPDHRIEDAPSGAPASVRQYCRELEGLA
jgi:methylated-DNA-[protein]-cysteine S-methyltransferase